VSKSIIALRPFIFGYLPNLHTDFRRLLSPAFEPNITALFDKIQLHLTDNPALRYLFLQMSETEFVFLYAIIVSERRSDFQQLLFESGNAKVDHAFGKKFRSLFAALRNREPLLRKPLLKLGLRNSPSSGRELLKVLIRKGFAPLRLHSKGLLGLIRLGVRFRLDDFLMEVDVSVEHLREIFPLLEGWYWPYEKVFKSRPNWQLLDLIQRVSRAGRSYAIQRQPYVLEYLRSLKYAHLKACCRVHTWLRWRGLCCQRSSGRVMEKMGKRC
jgi:hypothetical protein